MTVQTVSSHVKYISARDADDAFDRIIEPFARNYGLIYQGTRVNVKDELHRGRFVCLYQPEDSNRNVGFKLLEHTLIFNARNFSPREVNEFSEYLNSLREGVRK